MYKMSLLQFMIIFSSKYFLLCGGVSPQTDTVTRPPGTNSTDGPVIITVNLLLRRMQIDDIEMEHTLQLTFRQTWVDSRLAFGNMPRSPHMFFVDLDVDDEFGKKLWKPDTFFQNEVEDDTDDSNRPSSLIRIYRDGRILYSQKFTATFMCLMSFMHFPFDEQECSMDFASYKSTSRDIEYDWHATSPIQIKQGLHVGGGFQIMNTRTSECTSTTSTGTYSCLRIIIRVKRLASMDTHKVFGYSHVLVFASWIPFWLEPIDVAARAIIGTLLLATTVIFNELMTDDKAVERTSYRTLMHVWTDAILAFVVLAFLQLVVVVLLSPVQRVFKSRMYEMQNRDVPLMSSEDNDEITSGLGKYQNFFAVPMSKYHWGKRLSYALFNLIFWTAYMP